MKRAMKLDILSLASLKASKKHTPTFPSERLNMKGAVEIEFIIAVFVFITTMSFVTFIVINNIPLFHNTAVGELVKSRSYQFAEIMFFDEGYPANWESQPFASVQRVGFSTGKKYFLSQNKLSQLAALCQPLPGGAGYQAVKNRFAIDFEYDVMIEVSYLDNTPVIGSSNIICSPPVLSELRQQFQFTKLGILDTPDKNIVRMKFIVMR